MQGIVRDGVVAGDSSFGNGAFGEIRQYGRVCGMQGFAGLRVMIELALFRWRGFGAREFHIILFWRGRECGTGPRASGDE